MDNDASPTHIAPVGVWLDRIERTPEDAWRTRNVVFIGHLVPRQGVATLLEAIALLPDVNLTIAGRGPEEDRLRTLTAELGIADRVRFVGFISDHREVERLAASAAVAAAPYATDMESFTKYADPSKLRTYTGAGLPIVTTEVPPNAHELEREAGASVVTYEPRAIADRSPRYSPRRRSGSAAAPPHSLTQRASTGAGSSRRRSTRWVQRLGGGMAGQETDDVLVDPDRILGPQSRSEVGHLFNGRVPVGAVEETCVVDEHRV